MSPTPSKATGSAATWSHPCLLLTKRTYVRSIITLSCGLLGEGSRSVSRLQLESLYEGTEVCVKAVAKLRKQQSAAYSATRTRRRPRSYLFRAEKVLELHGGVNKRHRSGCFFECHFRVDCSKGRHIFRQVGILIECPEKWARGERTAFHRSICLKSKKAASNRISREHQSSYPRDILLLGNCSLSRPTNMVEDDSDLSGEVALKSNDGLGRR